MQIFIMKLVVIGFLKQNITDEESIANIITIIIDNRNEYLEKQNNMKNFSYQNTWNNINQKIKSIINEKLN